ncbi:hypothetical protein EHQ53_12655 [Leptospira langatensis]|uniref:Phosphotyrosine protein phosphatase I domain-containing protein n=1 Tax=Leptospira langatensis TaxID=2484983 RepID=A0A5F1ZSG1_9LEPT|nr:hypothetical protein [Leptospira langatensis]TGK02766.1 hypothetical protein EHO57_05455 [Leptospira langatensis]TGL40029.1 hypothetical protein EHQ53_12655 [Leptospira langatensis]
MSPLFQPLKKYLETQQSKMANIVPNRKKVLDSFSDAILQSFETRQKANLLFVCTQNSRRSQISQAFAAAIPQYFDLPGIKSFSGGTTISEFHPNAIQALETCGFRLENQGPPRNPKYSIRWADGTPALLAFSKKFQDQPNPTSEFVVILVCSQADESCPYVSGAEARISLPFEDPKSADDSENPLARYLQTCDQIASELLYTFQEVKRKL